jgi:hypothetical protein
MKGMFKLLKSLNQNWRRGTYMGLSIWMLCVVLNGAYNFTKVFDVVVCANLINLCAILVYARIRVGIKKTDANTSVGRRVRRLKDLWDME